MLQLVMVLAYGNCHFRTCDWVSGTAPSSIPTIQDLVHPRANGVSHQSGTWIQNPRHEHAMNTWVRLQTLAKHWPSIRTLLRCI